MSPAEIRELLAELNPGALFADGLDAALVGVGQQFNRYLAVYDTSKVLAQYEAGGMTRDEALEFFDFNVVGAWVGENTPIFLRTDLEAGL